MRECPTCGNDGNWEVEMSQGIEIEKLRRLLKDAEDNYKACLQSYSSLVGVSNQYKSVLEKIAAAGGASPGDKKHEWAREVLE